jgi:hypothetical protein
VAEEFIGARGRRPLGLHPDMVEQALSHDPTSLGAYGRRMQLFLAEHFTEATDEGGLRVLGDAEIQAKLRDFLGLDRAEPGSPEPLSHQEQDTSLCSREAPRTNLDVWENGTDVPMTQDAVDRVAESMGIDLSDIRVHLVTEPEEIRYLDYQQACACTPGEKGGDEIRLGPAAFADPETLARTVAHEYTHTVQLRTGRDVSTASREGLEDEAYASEEPAIERFRENFEGFGDGDSSVRGGSGVRPAEPAGTADLRDDVGGRDPTGPAAPGGEHGPGHDGTHGGVPDTGRPEEQPHHPDGGTDLPTRDPGVGTGHDGLSHPAEQAAYEAELGAGRDRLHQEIEQHPEVTAARDRVNATVQEWHQAEGDRAQRAVEATQARADEQAARANAEAGRRAAESLPEDDPNRQAWRDHADAWDRVADQHADAADRADAQAKADEARRDQALAGGQWPSRPATTTGGRPMWTSSAGTRWSTATTRAPNGRRSPAPTTRRRSGGNAPTTSPAGCAGCCTPSRSGWNRRCASPTAASSARRTRRRAGCGC